MSRGPRALAGVAGSTAGPYGYTITVWSAGALLIHFRGSPSVWEVFLFAAGAVLAFSLLAIVAERVVRRADPLQATPALIVAGMADWIAVSLAVGAAALIGQIGSWVAWPFASMAATAVFLLGTSAQLAVVDRLRSEGGKNR